jgi:triacylglycerol lipase
MSGETFAIVSFRGTQAESWTDRITGLKFWPRPWSGPGRVHRGFRAALMWVWPDLERFLARFRGAGRIRRSVWFTGHSLGGALATLAAHLFDDAQGVYTIGSPCVGDATFAAAFAAKMERRSIRYTHGRDTVTVLPPEHLLGYRHVGTHKHIIEDGRVVDVPPSGLTAAHRPTSLWRTCSARWRRGARGVGLIPWFADHTPKIYATHIWNDLDAQG